MCLSCYGHITVRNGKSHERQIPAFLKTKVLSGSLKRHIQVAAKLVVNGITPVVHLLFKKSRSYIDSRMNHAVVS